MDRDKHIVRDGGGAGVEGQRDVPKTSLGSVIKGHDGVSAANIN